MVDLLENNWKNPFDNRNTEPISLSSGAVPLESFCDDLSKAQEIGEHAFQMFVTEQLERLERLEKASLQQVHGPYYETRIGRRGHCHVVCRAQSFSSE